MLRRKGRIPQYPLGSERDYRVALLSLITKAKSLWRNIVIPRIRQDADEIPLDDLAIIEMALREFDQSLISVYSLSTAQALAQKTGTDAAKFILNQTQKSLVSVGAPADLGVNPLASNPDLRRLVESWANKNVELIQNVGVQVQQQIKDVVLTGYANGTSWRDIVKQVEAGLNGQAGRFATVENRAKLIARNEIGNLNSALTKYRYIDAGVEKYTWNTAGDNRVRDTHRALAGETFSLQGEGTAPGGIFPGSEASCRCVAQAVPMTTSKEMP